MRYLSLCSGIEAALCAWAPLGWEAVAFAEIDPFACAVLEHHYPNVPNLGDIKNINGAEYHETVDLVVGGTPCQDFSIAGKRAGMAGERSGLAREFVRIVSEISPEWIVWENVPGVFSTNGGRDFGTFIGALDECGYSCAWRVLDAQFFGVPQRRRRIFVVGHLGDWRPCAKILFERESLRGNPETRRKARQILAKTAQKRIGTGDYVPEIVSQAMSSKWAKGSSGPAGDECHNLVVQAPCATIPTKPYADNAGHESRLIVQPNDVASTLCASAAGTQRTSGQGNELGFLCLSYPQKTMGTLTADGAGNVNASSSHTQTDFCILHPLPRVRRLTPRECERLQGFPDDYTLVKYRGRPAADTPRYRALGNSMAVPVMCWLGKRIEADHNDKPLPGGQGLTKEKQTSSACGGKATSNNHQSM